jgi:hypothetical protein
MASPKFGTRKELLGAIFLVAITLSNLISTVGLAGLLREGYQNFTIFYAAARMVRAGQSNVLYDLQAESRAQEEVAPNVRIRKSALPYMHPPFEALLFVPFTFFSYVHAYLLWNVLNGVMALASVLLLRRQFPEISALSLAFVVLAVTGFLPVWSGIVQGQDASLLLLLYVVALTAAERGDDVSAGAALAAGLFKINLILPLVFLVAVKRPRLLLGFAPVAAFMGAISLAMIGWRGVAGYVLFLFRMENSGAGGAIVAGDMPNLRGMIAAVAGAHLGVWLMPITIMCSAVVIVAVLWRMAPPGNSRRFDFVLATVTAILVSYHAFSYDLSLLLPAVLLLFAAPVPEGRWSPGMDLLFLVLLYVSPTFDTFWPHVNQFCWPVVIMSWLFWKFGTAYLTRQDQILGHAL